jgi:hypothetical protein
MPGKTDNAQPGARTEAPAASAQAPSGREILLCEKTFAGFCKSLPDEEVEEAVLLCLVEADLCLLRIASARARRVSGSAAREAGTLARMAGALGFLKAAGLARQLEVACLSGDQTATYGLIGRLSAVFQTSGATLDAMLRCRIIAKPGC